MQLVDFYESQFFINYEIRQRISVYHLKLDEIQVHLIFCLIDPGERMYGHYTSQRGLLGIVSNEALWATNIKFLNDEHEFQHALDLIREIIPTSKITAGMKEHGAHKGFMEKLLARLEQLDNYTTESIFTLSFSSEIDLLSQWRGYCSDNKGYCLVYDVDGVFEKAKAKYKDAHLVDCVYKRDEKETKLRNLLNDYWSKYYTAGEGESQKDVVEELAKEVMLLASYYKHSSFSEEKERRIVVNLDFSLNSSLKFREGAFALVPYIELDAPRDHLKKICIGPTGNKRLSKRSVEMFLEKTYGYSPSVFGDLDVVYSETPYRAW